MASSQLKPTRFSNELIQAVETAKRAAAKYYVLNERPLGITGEVAEFEAIRILKLQQCGPRQKGHDALMKTSRNIEKVQIKGKVIQTDKIVGRMGSIRKNSDWDSVILVILNSDFEVQWIYKAGKKIIEETLNRPGSKARNDRRAMGLKKFTNIGERIWPKRKTTKL